MSTLTATTDRSVASPRYKEVLQTKVSELIYVSADRLWEIVGPGFADAGKWSTAVDHSAGSGAPQFEGATCHNRQCDINAKGFSKISETLTEYDDGRRILAYDAHSGLPGFVLNVNNRWRVIETGPNQSKLEMTITMRMKPLMGSLMGGLFRKNLNQTIDSVMADLKVYAETGQVSDAKKARMRKLAAKK